MKLMHTMTVLILSLIFLAALFGFAYAFLLKKPERFVVYYTGTLPASEFAAYDVIAFDRSHHPPLAPLIKKNKILLGYISLGEAEVYRDNYQTVKEKNLLLNTGKDWSGNPIIDTRNSAWTVYVLNELIPAIRAQGFDGIMIDTVDSITWLENTHPDRYEGMKSAMVRLIKAIRLRYPDLRIMLNRGFDILPEVATDIDMFLAESTYSTLNTVTNEWYESSASERAEYVKKIKAAQAKSPNLKVYTLDYWPTDDVQTIKKIYATHRQEGFIPYVSTMDLQAHTPEP